MNGTAGSRNTLSTVFLVAAIICAIGAIAMIATGNIVRAGFFFMGFFAAFALYSRGNDTLKGFSFTIWIFFAVSISMYYPQLFIQWGSYKLTRLIEPLMMIIMFGYKQEQIQGTHRRL